MIKDKYPETEIIGLDCDPNILAKAKSKITDSGLEIQIKESMAFNLPFENKYFDRIVSSLMFHHLTSKDKKSTLQECYRVLKPDGQLHIADWGKPSGFLSRILFFTVQFLDGFATTKDTVEGRLPKILESAGFINIQERHRFFTVFGNLSVFAVQK